MFPLSAEIDANEPGQLFAPLAAAYKNPILILNDRFSGSGGDFVPAMLQSAGRGFVMGETSMGLGGPVYRRIDSLPGSELSMRCTIGLCLRADGLPIENIGVVPDLPRSVRSTDLMDGFRSYSGDVLETALLVLEGKDRTALQQALQERIIRRTSLFSSRGVADVRAAAQEYHDAFARVQQPQDWIALLEEYLPKISSAGASLKPQQWREIIVPLPTPLVQSDLILSSLWRRDEVLQRLKEMKNLSRIQSNADLANLIDYWLAWSETFNGEVRFANPCDLLLLQRLATAAPSAG